MSRYKPGYVTSKQKVENLFHNIIKRKFPQDKKAESLLSMFYDKYETIMKANWFNLSFPQIEFYLCTNNNILNDLQDIKNDYDSYHKNFFVSNNKAYLRLFKFITKLYNAITDKQNDNCKECYALGQIPSQIYMAKLDKLRKGIYDFIEDTIIRDDGKYEIELSLSDFSVILYDIAKISKKYNPNSNDILDVKSVFLPSAISFDDKMHHKNSGKYGQQYDQDLDKINVLMACFVSKVKQIKQVKTLSDDDNNIIHRSCGRSCQQAILAVSKAAEKENNEVSKNVFRNISNLITKFNYEIESKSSNNINALQNTLLTEIKKQAKILYQKYFPSTQLNDNDIYGHTDDDDQKDDNDDNTDVQELKVFKDVYKDQCKIYKHHISKIKGELLTYIKTHIDSQKPLTDIHQQHSQILDNIIKTPCSIASSNEIKKLLISIEKLDFLGSTIHELVKTVMKTNLNKLTQMDIKIELENIISLYNSNKNNHEHNIYCYFPQDLGHGDNTKLVEYLKDDSVWTLDADVVGAFTTLNDLCGHIVDKNDIDLDHLLVCVEDDVTLPSPNYCNDDNDIVDVMGGSTVDD